MEHETLVTDEVGLRKWLDAVRTQRRIIAPVRKEEVVLLAAVSSGGEVALDFDITRNSPKEAFFPASEDILTFRLEGRSVSISSAAVQPEETLLFAVRACDVRALAVSDAVFKELGGRRDDYYAMRREKTAVAALWCTSVREWCRCGSFGSPLEAVNAHADILITPLEGAFALDGLTEKGRALLSPAELFSPASEDQVARRDEVHRTTEQEVRRHPQITALEESCEALWDHPVWKELGKRCLGCGICTYLCPACTCFDILDECPGTLGRRYKCWDSCQFALFTVHASGHNPRPDQASRVRQRILHKFKFGPQLTGEMGCVGCGRCLELCPMAIRYTDILESLKAEALAPAAAGREGTGY